MTIDKAEWHYAGNWPDAIPIDQAYVHTGLFLGWVLKRNLQSTQMNEHYGHLIEEFKARRISCVQLFRATGGSLVEEDLNEEAAEFATDFYNKYLEQYANVVDAGESGYEIEDSAANLEKMVVFLDAAFEKWRKDSKYQQTAAADVDLASILESMSRKSGHSLDQCRSTYQCMLDIVAKVLADRGRVTLEGFGTFETYSSKTPAIQLKNKGESIPEHFGTHVRFNAAVDFKKAVG